MDQTKKPDVNKVINQMQMIKFQGVFMATMELLKKEPIMLVALFIAPLIVTGLLENYIYPPILGAASAGGALVVVILGIVLAVLSALISFFGFGLLMRATSNVFDGKKVDVGALLPFVQKYFVDAIKLAIQLFIYTGAWIVLAYFILAALLIPVAVSLSGMLMMLAPLAVIIYIVLFFKKLINASMSYAIFWSAEKPEVDGSLKRSLELCEGLSWTIFGNYLLMGLVGVLVSFVLVAVLGAILLILGRLGAAVAGAVAGGVVGTFYSVFQYCLKGQVEKFRGGHHAEAVHHAPAHHTQA